MIWKNKDTCSNGDSASLDRCEKSELANKLAKNNRHTIFSPLFYTSTFLSNYLRPVSITLISQNYIILNIPQNERTWCWRWGAGINSRSLQRANSCWVVVSAQTGSLMESWDVRRNSFVGWHPPVAPTAQILREGRSGSGDGAAAAGTVWVHLLAARNEGKRCRGARVVSLRKSINDTECTACIQACTHEKHERAACRDPHRDPVILLSTPTMHFNLQ